MLCSDCPLDQVLVCSDTDCSETEQIYDQPWRSVNLTYCLTLAKQCPLLTVLRSMFLVVHLHCGSGSWKRCYCLPESGPEILEATWVLLTKAAR